MTRAFGPRRDASSELGHERQVGGPAHVHLQASEPRAKCAARCEPVGLLEQRLDVGERFAGLRGGIADVQRAVADDARGARK